jgi:hypothetical protein
VSVAAPAHPVRWTAPAPLWDSATAPTPMATPTLLRLTGDHFLEDLQAMLADDPGRIAGLVATPRSHRVRPPGRAPDWEPAGVTPPLKLYGAVHGQFNLVAASLICGVPGLPERRLRTAEGDRVVFVLRRIAVGGGEEGWIPGNPEGRWAPATGAELLDGEEQLPMFSLDYADADGHPRRLHVGLVPTASVESWTPPAPPVLPEAAGLAKARHEGEVVQLTDTYRTLMDAKVWSGPADHVANAFDAADLWLIDFADLLQRWHPAIWTGIAPGAPAPLTRPKLHARLQDARLADGSALSARLHEAWNRREALLGEAGVPRQSLGLSLAGLHDPNGGGVIDPKSLNGDLLLAPRVADAPPPAAAGQQADPHRPRRPKLDPSGRTEHVIRCAYLRPHCADVHGPIVSAATVRFRLASFFDPDAPARDVHIALPIDTGVKDLRKLRKSVTVAISDQMQRQMSRVGELGEMIKGNRKDSAELDFALVCSFSIPIITLCALIVLMIFVILLNLIFFWLPLLKICLPVPKVGS